MIEQKEEKLLDTKSILAKAGISEGMRVAELGSGPSGHFVFPVADLVGKSGKVYAVDVLKSAVDGVKRLAHLENYHNVVAVWSDLETYNACNIESNSLDIAFLINTLYQSKQNTAIIREASRMLRKGGQLIVVEWKKSSLPFGPSKGSRVDSKHLNQIAKKHSLNFEEEFFAGNYHYGLIFSKI